MHASARWRTIALLATGAVLCVVALAGCGGSDTRPTTGTMAGVTRSSRTLLPIGVALTFTGSGGISGINYTTTSNAGTGAYSVATRMQPGTYTVSARDSDTLLARAVEAPPATDNRVTITAGVSLRQDLVIVIPPAAP